MWTLLKNIEIKYFLSNSLPAVVPPPQFIKFMDPDYIVAMKNDHIWKKSSSKDKNHLNLFKQTVWIKYLPRQGCILQLFWSFADPAQIPPEFSTLRFVLVRDSIPSSQVLEHRDQLDQEPHSQSTGNMKIHYIGVKCSYFWFAKHLNRRMEIESWNFLL